MGPITDTRAGQLKKSSVFPDFSSFTSKTWHAVLLVKCDFENRTSKVTSKNLLFFVLLVKLQGKCACSTDFQRFCRFEFPLSIWVVRRHYRLVSGDVVRFFADCDQNPHWYLLFSGFADPKSKLTILKDSDEFWLILLNSHEFWLILLNSHEFWLIRTNSGGFTL